MNELHSIFKIAELIAKRLEGKLTNEEELILNEWKYDNQENLTLYHKLSKNPESNFFKNENQLEGVKSDQVWQNINKNINQKKTKRFRTEFLKYAASLVVIGISINTNKIVFWIF